MTDRQTELAPLTVEELDDWERQARDLGVNLDLLKLIAAARENVRLRAFVAYVVDAAKRGHIISPKHQDVFDRLIDQAPFARAQAQADHTPLEMEQLYDAFNAARGNGMTDYQAFKLVLSANTLLEHNAVKPTRAAWGPLGPDDVEMINPEPREDEELIRRLRSQNIPSQETEDAADRILSLRSEVERLTKSDMEMAKLAGERANHITDIYQKLDVCRSEVERLTVEAQCDKEYMDNMRAEVERLKADPPSEVIAQNPQKPNELRVETASEVITPDEDECFHADKVIASLRSEVERLGRLYDMAFQGLELSRCEVKALRSEVERLKTECNKTASDWNDLWNTPGVQEAWRAALNSETKP